MLAVTWRKENTKMQKLKKPFTKKEKLNFIVKFNHQMGLSIEETETALYALEPWEELKGDEVISNKEAWEKEQEQKEKERIKILALTAADVERAIYKAKGMDFEDIVEFIKSNPPEGLDIKALKIELKANNFYRGNPYVEQIGTLLGYTSEDIDYLFKNKELPIKEGIKDDNLV